MRKIPLLLVAVILLSLLYALRVDALDTDYNVERFSFYPEMKGCVNNKKGAHIYQFEYNAPDGADYDEKYILLKEDKKNTIPYKTESLIEERITINSVDYFKWEGRNVFLLGEDISFDLSPVKPIEEDEWGNRMKYNASHSIRAVNPEGAFLYSGPNKMYEKVSETIPCDAELKFNYYRLTEDGNITWAYTSYKGVYGWAFVWYEPPIKPDFVEKTNNSREEVNDNHINNELFFVKETPIFKDFYSIEDYYYEIDYKNTDRRKVPDTGIIGYVPANIQLKYDFFVIGKVIVKHT